MCVIGSGGAAGQALDLSAEATVSREFKDWWWKARLGKCYYKLGESYGRQIHIFVEVWTFLAEKKRYVWVLFVIHRI